MDLPDLVRHRPERVEPEDFDVFWAKTLVEARNVDVDLEVVPTDSPVSPPSRRRTPPSVDSAASAVSRSRRGFSGRGGRPTASRRDLYRYVGGRSLPYDH